MLPLIKPESYAHQLKCNSLICDVVVETSLCEDVAITVSDFLLLGRTESQDLRLEIRQEHPEVQDGLAGLPSWISYRTITFIYHPCCIAVYSILCSEGKELPDLVLSSQFVVIFHFFSSALCLLVTAASCC